MAMMTIGKAALAADINVETIRFYERKGLIEQPLKPLGSGARVYPQETIQRLRFIRQAQDLGFSLKEIAGLLSLRADPDADCGDVQKRARDKLADIDRKIAKLQNMRTALVPLIEACPRRGPLQACSILEALTNQKEGE